MADALTFVLICAFSIAGIVILSTLIKGFAMWFIGTDKILESLKEIQEYTKNIDKLKDIYENTIPKPQCCFCRKPTAEDDLIKIKNGLLCNKCLNLLKNTKG